MELYLQFGWGMKKISIDLSKEWNGATSILSPRDITPQQLENWQKEFNKYSVSTLFDPQCYYPKSNHKNLMKYAYWDSSFSTNLDSQLTYEEELISDIYRYNIICNSIKFIIPSAMHEYDEKWLKKFKKDSGKLVSAAKKIVVDREHLLTLALPSSLLLQKEDEVERLLIETEKLDVDGYYIIAQPPQDKYLVDTPMWLSNLMQLCAGLKLQGRYVVMGYGNHQLLALSSTGIDAMATGTYLNVRRFTNKFDKNDSIQRKSVWYYYPASLSEYKLGFLDTAYTNNVLHTMKPTKDMNPDYTSILFSGALPSSVQFSETDAFMHYLNSIKVQMSMLSKNTYKDTISANEIMLETAMRAIEFLEKNGVYAQARSFKDMVDVNRSALQRLDSIRGFQLAQEWKNL